MKTSGSSDSRQNIVLRALRNAAIAPLLLLIYLYKYLISPLLPKGCRHWPSCSTYSVDALRMHGPFRGSLLSADRILRCHPWGTSGYDPVPKYLVKKFRPGRSLSTTKNRYPRCNRLKSH